MINFVQYDASIHEVCLQDVLELLYMRQNLYQVLNKYCICTMCIVIVVTGKHIKG